MANVEDIMEGTVTGIKEFGAFVQLSDGTTGLVHISEVSDGYVKDVKDFLTEGQLVKVVSLTGIKEGKLRLSIKKANEILGVKSIRTDGSKERDFRDKKPMGERKTNGFRSDSRGKQAVSAPKNPLLPPPDEWQAPVEGAFEDKMSKFMKDSEERLSAIKKQTENKRGGGYVRRG